MNTNQAVESQVEWSVVLEVAIMVLCGPVALVAVLVLPALPGVGGA